MSDRCTITQIVLNENETLRKEKRVVKQPNYIKIGNGTMNKHNIKSINLIAEICKMSDSGRYMIDKIQEKMVWNPFEDEIDFVVKVVAETDAEKKRLVRGFEELSSKNLVRRVKRGHYMINPNAIITDYSKQMRVWTAVEIKTENTES